MRGIGDISDPHVEPITGKLGLVVDDLGLSRFEAKLSAMWPVCLERDEGAFRIESAFHRTILRAADMRAAAVALIDVGPNLSVINRAAIIAADFVVSPLAPDLLSLQGLRSLGPTLRSWRNEWRERVECSPDTPCLPLPPADITPVGYVVIRQPARAGRPVQSYRKWMGRIPGVYHDVVLDEAGGGVPSAEDDAQCLSTLKHYLSLMPMAEEARKPVFHLKAADGALGGHIYAVQDCYEDFKALAASIATTCELYLYDINE